nr:cytochrome C [Chitinophagaceae bacterium]
MKALKISSLIILVIVLLIALAVSYIKIFLPNTGPASDVKIESTPQRIERGKYLANHVTLCVDCHSTRDWTLYAAPMQTDSLGGGGEAFTHDFEMPGTFYARNISQAKLGTWTDGEILRAVTTGVDKNGKALFPLMGYLRYGKMDQEDIYSIIAYIKTLPPVQREIPAPDFDFPVNILLNTMPHKAAFSKRPDENDKVKYGGYMVNAAGCVECHSRREKGEIVPGSEFGGGMQFKMPGGVTT